MQGQTQGEGRESWESTRDDAEAGKPFIVSVLRAQGRTGRCPHPVRLNDSPPAPPHPRALKGQKRARAITPASPSGQSLSESHLEATTALVDSSLKDSYFIRLVDVMLSGSSRRR